VLKLRESFKPTGVGCISLEIVGAKDHTSRTKLREDFSVRFGEGRARESDYESLADFIGERVHRYHH